MNGGAALRALRPVTTLPYRWSSLRSSEPMSQARMTARSWAGWPPRFKSIAEKSPNRQYVLAMIIAGTSIEALIASRRRLSEAEAVEMFQVLLDQLSVLTLVLCLTPLLQREPLSLTATEG